MPKYTDFDLDIINQTDIIATNSYGEKRTFNGIPSLCLECDYTRQPGCTTEYFC